MSLLSYKRRAEGSKHEHEEFTGLDFRSMKAFGATFKDCTFRNCNLDVSDLRNTRFDDCAFVGCSARLVNFAASFFEDVTFEDCDFEGSSFEGCHFRLINFIDCRMAYSETLFSNATIRGATRFHGCNLHGSSLDFREVEPGALSFRECNLWSAKIAFGCAFFNATLDEPLVQQFLALVARVSEDPRVVELAGDQYGVVCRAMDGRKRCQAPDSPKTTESRTLSFPVATATMDQSLPTTATATRTDV